MPFCIPVPSFWVLRNSLLAVAIALVMAGHAIAGDLISSRAYVVDATGQKSLAQIEAEPATPFTGVLSRGYTHAAIWLRLEITPPKEANTDEDIVLRIRPVFLDEIRLFDPLDTSSKARTVGDTMPMSAEEYASLSHTFVMPASDQSRVVWLRVKTTSTFLINVEALSRSEMMASELKLNMAYFAVLAIVGMFAMLVLFSWVNHRDSLYAVFTVRQIYYFFYTASLFGMHRQMFAGVESFNADTVFSWIVIAATALSLYFEYRFLSEYALSKWAQWMLKSLLGLSAVVFVLMLAGQTMAALRLNMQLSTISILVLLLVAMFFIDKHQVETQKDKVLLSKRLVVGYYLSVFLVLGFSVLPYLGLMDGNEFAVNGLVFFAVSSGLIMTALMQFRAHKQTLVKAEYEKRFLLSEQSAQLEKRRREEQNHLFHMLLHELKTPLSIIDMALLAKNDEQTTSSYVSRAVGTMKDILDRCVKADKLTEGEVDIRLVDINLNQFIQNLLDQKTGRAVDFVTPKPFNVMTDSQFLTVMLSNLLDNAERYGDEREAIHIVGAHKQNDSGDNGVSITIANRPSTASWPDPERVFTKYYRSPGAETQSGTGLGLHLVRTLARLVGGDCLYVPDDKYIKFEVWLPS